MATTYAANPNLAAPTAINPNALASLFGALMGQETSGGGAAPGLVPSMQLGTVPTPVLSADQQNAYNYFMQTLQAAMQPTEQQTQQATQSALNGRFGGGITPLLATMQSLAMQPYANSVSNAGAGALQNMLSQNQNLSNQNNQFTTNLLAQLANTQNVLAAQAYEAQQQRQFAQMMDQYNAKLNNQYAGNAAMASGMQQAGMGGGVGTGNAITAQTDAYNNSVDQSYLNPTNPTGGPTGNGMVGAAGNFYPSGFVPSSIGLPSTSTAFNYSVNPTAYQLPSYGSPGVDISSGSP